MSMRSVADRLGVSVPGLYHYVQGRDDLMALAAEQSAARIPLPVDRGQHWAAWLLEWAEVIRRTFVESPALLAQFMNGVFGLDRMVDALDQVLALLVRQGFDHNEAYEAYVLVTQCAMGAAVGEIRTRESERAGEPAELEFQRVLARRGKGDLPDLRAMIGAGGPPRPGPTDQLTTVLAGIAARRGDDWREVVAQLNRPLGGGRDSAAS